MEAITHILTGVILQILSFRLLITPWNYLLTIILAFISHFLIDAVAKITYHTAEPMKDDTFWVIWHIIVILISIIFTIIFINPYWIGILSANFVDIWDWIIIRIIYSKYILTPDKNKSSKIIYIHTFIDKIRERFFSWLPNLNYKKIGILPEIFIISGLLIIIFILK
ncbi:MAG: hypothetical protein GF317_12770 [Candidatus Lokiarchaeota archaeon]|nr:hypothetical protein [Candidatus Lokiarchaeota archaeon]MBD3200514.1 hypothetical protein [Candidatus Lokiarchaeota archaeon]